jgi:hypothetical protein
MIGVPTAIASSADVDPEVDVAGNREHGADDLRHPFRRVKTSGKAEAHRPFRGSLVGARLAHDAALTQPQAIEGELLRRRTVSHEHPMGRLVQHDEPLHDLEELALHVLILDHERAHAENGAGLARQNAQHRTE